MRYIILISLFYINTNVFSIDFIKKSETDTSKDNFISNSSIIPLADSMASSLFKSDSVFIKYWDNKHLFVYKNVDFSGLPDTISLNLIRNKENFTFNWYGSVSSHYGSRWGRKHEGMDIPLHTGDTVVSSFDGVVRFAQYTNSGYGNCIIIRHLNGLETLYGHLSKIEVSENQFVRSGELIGLGGSTGRSTGPHLHFETRFQDYSFNPAKIIDINNRKLVDSTMVFTKKDLFSERFIIKTEIKTSNKKVNPKKTHSTNKTKKKVNKKEKTQKTKDLKKSKKENKSQQKKKNTKANSSKEKIKTNQKSKKKNTETSPRKKDKTNVKISTKKKEKKKKS
jgi:hypothetical protein